MIAVVTFAIILATIVVGLAIVIGIAFLADALITMTCKMSNRTLLLVVAACLVVISASLTAKVLA